VWISLILFGLGGYSLSLVFPDEPLKLGVMNHGPSPDSSGLESSVGDQVTDRPKADSTEYEGGLTLADE
jgi:hypothetical protein